MIRIGIPLLFSMRMVLLVHFHVSHVGVDPSLGPCKQKVVVLFRSGVVSFYNLLFCVISGDMLNATSIYLIKCHLSMKVVIHPLQNLLLISTFCLINFPNAELW